MNNDIQKSTLDKFPDVQILARTIYGEARGEYKNCGTKALEAIGCVVRNRSIERNQSIRDVCLAPSQFSCWNRNDPNRLKILMVNTNDKLFLICLDIAQRIIENKISDFTYGSNHYYSKYLKSIPYWAKGRIPKITIGNHIFFKL